MKNRRQYLLAFVFLALLASALPASAAETPEQEGVGVAEFTIVGHRFRIPKAYLTQKGDMAGRVTMANPGSKSSLGTVNALSEPSLKIQIKAIPAKPN